MPGKSLVSSPIRLVLDPLPLPAWGCISVPAWERPALGALGLSGSKSRSISCAPLLPSQKAFGRRSVWFHKLDGSCLKGEENILCLNNLRRSMLRDQYIKKVIKCAPVWAERSGRMLQPVCPSQKREKLWEAAEGQLTRKSFCPHDCRQAGSWSQGSDSHVWPKAELNHTQI